MIHHARFITRSLTLIGAALAITAVTSAKTANHAATRATARIFTCHFPKGGTVVIDTREPSASITVNGKRYPAQSGSSFYQTEDGSLAVMFGPGASFKFWEYDGERDYRCAYR